MFEDEGWKECDCGRCTDMRAKLNDERRLAALEALRAEVRARQEALREQGETCPTSLEWERIVDLAEAVEP